MPNGLLLPGGIDAPQALSTAHCATVTDAGTVHFSREAIAASATRRRHLAEMPSRRRAARLLPTAGRRVRNRSHCLDRCGLMAASFPGWLPDTSRWQGSCRHRPRRLPAARMRLWQAIVQERLDDEHVTRGVGAAAAHRSGDRRCDTAHFVDAQHRRGWNKAHAGLLHRPGSQSQLFASHVWRCCYRCAASSRTKQRARVPARCCRQADRRPSVRRELLGAVASHRLNQTYGEPIWTATSMPCWVSPPTTTRRSPTCSEPGITTRRSATPRRIGGHIMSRRAFTPLRKPLAQSRVTIVTTAAPYRPEKGDQGPGAPYNGGAKFYEVYSGDTSQDARPAHFPYRL